MGSKAVKLQTSSSSLETPPESREEAIAQAATSLVAILGRSLKAPDGFSGKSRKKGASNNAGPRTGRQNRLRIELPLLDDSPATMAELVADLLQAFLASKPGSDRRRVGICFGDLEAVAAAQRHPALSKVLQSGSWAAWALENDSDEESNFGAVFVVGPKSGQLDRLKNLVTRLGSQPVVVVNPDWAETEQQEEDSDGKREFFKSFEVCYCFMPLAVKGIFGSSEGAVLKFVRGGAPAGTPWVVLKSENGQMRRITTAKERPTAEQLETIMYASMAANSPVSKSIQFVQSLMGKSK